MIEQGSFLRPGWGERYELRGSRTVMRGAGVRLPGLLTFKGFIVGPFEYGDEASTREWFAPLMRLFLSLS